MCSFRSSFYSDVVQHFATFHRETPFLLCVFCLKVMKNSGNYQQHLFRHKVSIHLYTHKPTHTHTHTQTW